MRTLYEDGVDSGQNPKELVESSLDAHIKHVQHEDD